MSKSTDIKEKKDTRPLSPKNEWIFNVAGSLCLTQYKLRQKYVFVSVTSYTISYTLIIICVFVTSHARIFDDSSAVYPKPGIDILEIAGGDTHLHGKGHDMLFGAQNGDIVLAYLHITATRKWWVQFVQRGWESENEKADQTDTLAGSVHEYFNFISDKRTAVVHCFLSSGS